MKPLLLYNPSSGTGRARVTAVRLAAAMRQRGHDPSLRETGPNGDHARRVEALQASDAAIVVGGDGTVHHLLPDLLEAGTPVYHAPLGTENLVARDFRMRHTPEAVVEALERKTTTRVDVARFNETPFLIMCSCGFDAAVIHRLHEKRHDRISHATYIAPILKELAHFNPPRLRISTDEGVLVDDEPGLLVVANSRQYALRMNPARRAEMTDGKLDLVFYPAKSRTRLIRWAIATALGQHLSSRAIVAARASRFRIEPLDEAARFQFDGEPASAPRSDAGRCSAVDLAVLPGALPLLV